MKRLSCNTTNDYNSYSWVFLVLLIFTICLISIDASFAQTNRPQDGDRQFSVNGKTFKHKKRVANTSRANCPQMPNRSIDGTCNNIQNEEKSNWGATDIDLYRNMYPAYGAPDFYNDMAGNCRISPRAISNLVCAQSEDLPSPRNLSSLVFTWGQFIDHDIDLTPEGETEYVPILLPANEPLFSSPIPFLRSEPYAGTGVTSPRQQQNIISSWLDASQIYGSEESRAQWLRTFNQGKLKTSSNNLLPYNTTNGNFNSAIDPNAPSMAGDDGGTVKVFVAGDVRANEQPGLTALHTLFVREHNRICDRLVDQGFQNDEQNYQRARKLVGAYIQNISYRFFLPALGVKIAPYQGYNPNRQPDISNIFASAAYRLGHTMVTNEIPLVGSNCDEVGSGSLALLESFFNPEVLATYGIEPIINGLATQVQQKVDTRIVDNLRNFLFPIPGSNQVFGLDLASLNIQRGRDHGLPDYNSIRSHYLGSPISDFNDITSDANLKAELEAAYGSVYDMDAWVGLLAEDPMPGSSIGPTMNAILANQFEHIRDGDFYYFQKDPAFSNQQKDQIRNTSLRDIIERNTPIESLQNNVFFADECTVSGGGQGGGGHGGGGSHHRTELNEDILPTQSLSIYPNPTEGIIQITLLLEYPQDNVLIQINNLEGREIYRTIAKVEAKALNYKMDLSGMTPGIYFLKVQAGKERFVKKLIIE